MLPTTTECLKDERSKDTAEASHSATNFLRQLSLHRSISRGILPIFKLIIVLGASVTVLLYYLSLGWTVFVEDQSYGIAAVQGQLVRYLIESRPCLDLRKDCYIVYDAVDMFTGDVNRFLITQHVPMKHETVVRLIPPTGLRSKESDSRFWKVNHTHINRQYVAVMLTVPFGVAALALSTYANTAANILIVGLGGGRMNMFLANHFPKMAITVVELDEVAVDLAWRWFGLEKKREKLQIIMMDGVKFIEEAALKKTLFDVVLIDVCEDAGDVICPTESFIRPRIVVLNVLPRENVLDLVDEVVHTYRKQFPTCVVAALHNEMNTILACQSVHQVDPHATERLVSERFQEAWDYFGFVQQFGVVELSFTNGKSKRKTLVDAT
ncbi:unnamed protein product [Litomosoides sigmodontis]|uniref:PABS domain-containing protein n=1 Tax=Litomosoides sigmodontis TaxID=42156 RepID=A0A3P6SPX3_LITSI|nr:unnamed protein product [Litomosoides sigmodontis]